MKYAVNFYMPHENLLELVELLNLVVFRRKSDKSQNGFGSFRWCVESPLNPSTEKMPTRTDRKEASAAFDESSRYSQLHYSLLESMLERTSLQTQQLLLQAEVVSPRHLVALVKGLSDSLAKNTVAAANVQLTLDRLAQAIQVAQSSGCLYGNIRNSSLPELFIPGYMALALSH